MIRKFFSFVILTGLFCSACSRSTPSGPSAGPTGQSGACSDSAAFEADVSVPDYSHYDPGATFEKTWKIKNTGDCTWTESYSLVFAKGEQMKAAGSVPLKKTAPGESLEISVNMTAPTKDGTYRADFEVHNADGAAIPIDKDKYLWVIVNVGNVTAGSGSSGSGGTGGGGGAGLTTSTCAFTTDSSKVSAAISAINAYRTKNGLAAYTVNGQLTQAAQAHSEDMACNNLFVHTGSNGSSPASRVADSGYAASSVTENVYGSYPPLGGSDVVSWWATDQTDSTHNANLIATKYSEIGVGYAYFNNYGYYVVDFAAP